MRLFVSVTYKHNDILYNIIIHNYYYVKTYES